jgi:hypothetical protein
MLSVNGTQTSKTRWAVLAAFAVLALGIAGPGWPVVMRVVAFVHGFGSGGKTTQERVEEFGAVVAARLRPAFERAGVSYPPARLALIGLKTERALQVYAADSTGEFRFIRSYPILAASGTLGPKLREGDGQVPEGVYRIESLNPNSRYHLALRVSYPNEFDRQQARADGRKNLGGDIMIHGGAASIGCLAMGDEAAEDLFVLAALTGISNIAVVIAPVDFRTRELPAGHETLPAWTKELYANIKAALAPCPVALGTASGRTGSL